MPVQNKTLGVFALSAVTLCAYRSFTTTMRIVVCGVLEQGPKPHTHYLNSNTVHDSHYQLLLLSAWKAHSATCYAAAPASLLFWVCLPVEFCSSVTLSSRCYLTLQCTLLLTDKSSTGLLMPRDRDTLHLAGTEQL